MKKSLLFLATFAFFSLFSVSPVFATQGSVLGIHILVPAEAQSAKELLTVADSSQSQDQQQ